MKIDIRRVDGYPLFRGTLSMPVGSSEFYTVEGAGDTEAETTQDVVRQVKATIMRLQEFCALNSEAVGVDLNVLVKESRRYGDYSINEPMQLMETAGGRVEGTNVQIPAGQVLVKGNLIEILNTEENPYFAAPVNVPDVSVTEVQAIDFLVNNPRRACVMTINDMRVHFSYGGSAIKGAPLSFYYRAQYCITNEEDCTQVVFDADYNIEVADWFGDAIAEVPAKFKLIIDCLIETEKKKDMNASTKELRLALAQQETQNEDSSVAEKDS